MRGSWERKQMESFRTEIEDPIVKDIIDLERKLHYS
jgi:hypothetical protein